MKLSRVRTSPVRWLQGGRTEMITSIITFPRTGPEIKSQFCKTYAPIARAGKSGIATETVMFPYEIFHVSNSSTTPGRKGVSRWLTSAVNPRAVCFVPAPQMMTLH
nr:CXXC-type zinc finger protein 5 isoform X3 [Caretta caretta]